MVTYGDICITYPQPCLSLLSRLFFFFSVFHLFFFLFKFIYLFLREREQAGEGQRERIPSRLCTVSTEPNMGLEPTNWDHDPSQNQTVNQLSHAGALCEPSLMALPSISSFSNSVRKYSITYFFPYPHMKLVINFYPRFLHLQMPTESVPSFPIVTHVI